MAYLAFAAGKLRKEPYICLPHIMCIMLFWFPENIAKFCKKKIIFVVEYAGLLPDLCFWTLNQGLHIRPRELFNTHFSCSANSCK